MCTVKLFVLNVSQQSILSTRGNADSPVHQAERVDLDEAGTVNEHLGTHVTQGD